MKLSRLTPANKFNIKVPIWNKRAVGLAANQVGLHNEINILAVDKLQKRYYPDTYYASGDQIRNCETQIIRGVKLHIVPISQLDLLERE